MDKQQTLLKLLTEKGLISSAQQEEIKKTEEYLAGKLDSYLVKKQIVGKEDLTQIKAEIVNLPYENFLGQKMKEQALCLIPAEVTKNYKLICFDNTDGIIKVGLTDPNNFKAIEAIDFLAKKENLRVKYFLISEESFNYALKQYQTLNREVDTALKSKEIEETVEKAIEEKKESTDDVTKSAPVAKIVSVIIRHAIEGRASDIHIEPMRQESRVRYRIDGILHTSLVLPKHVHNAIVGRIKVLANLKLDETRVPQDGRIRMSFDGKEVDLRISILPLLGEEKVVMRILDVSRGAPTMEDLGFVGRGAEIIKRNIKKTDGLFLVTGPTGSGKSTTLFSVLVVLNKEGVNIVTLEDPIEYFIKGINQSLVRPEIGFTFASGLRSLLRQDPDIIMVGEIRDNETAELSIHAGLTGHLVLSTLHTNNALGAIPRLLDMEVEPFLLASTLNTVVAQRLARKICPKCKTEEEVSPELLADIKKEIEALPEGDIKKLIPDFDINKMKFYKGKGCSYCGHKGYDGRIALAEVLDIDDGVREAIMDKKKVLTTEEVRASQGFVTMKQDGIIKALMGVTSIEEVLSTIHDE
jgi:type IV pilus assembly protein PilB